MKNIHTLVYTAWERFSVLVEMCRTDIANLRDQHKAVQAQ